MQVSRTQNKWLQFFKSPVGAGLLVGLLSFIWRIPFCIRYDLNFAGDSATCHLMSVRMLKGIWPLYFYGQDYFGTLEQYLVAAFYWVFQPNIILGSLLHMSQWAVAAGMVTTYVAREYGPQARWWVLPVLVIGVPYTLHNTATVYNGYLPSILIPICLYALLDYSRKNSRAWVTLLIGGVVGFSWYLSKLTLPGMVAAFVVFFLARPWQGKPVSWGVKFLTFLTLGAVAGYLPEIIFRISHPHFRNLTQFVSSVMGLLQNLRQAALGLEAYFNGQPVSRVPESLLFFTYHALDLNRHPGPFDVFGTLLGIGVLFFSFATLFRFRKKPIFSVFHFLVLWFLINFLMVAMGSTTHGDFFSARRYLFPSSIAISVLTGLFFFSLAQKWLWLARTLCVVFLGWSIVCQVQFLRSPDQLADVRQICQEMESRGIQAGISDWGVGLTISALSHDKIAMAEIDSHRIPEYKQRFDLASRVAHVTQNKTPPQRLIKLQGRTLALVQTNTKGLHYTWHEYMVQ